MKIVTLIGGDSQVGTTMIAQSLGESLGNYGKRVLLLFASGNFGMDYVRQGNGTIDDINTKEGEKNGNTFVKEAIEHNERISYISGIKRVQDLPFYPIDFVGKVAKDVEEEFDFMIVDGGSNINSPLTISALAFAETRYIVLTQQEKTIRRYRNIRDVLLAPKDLRGEILLNKYKEEEGLYTKEHVEFLLAEDVRVGFSYREEGWEKECEKETLMTNEIFAQEMCALRDLVLKSEMSNKMKGGSFVNEKTGEYTRTKRRVFFR